MNFAKREELLSKLKEIVKNEIRFSLVKQDAPLDVQASRFGGMPAVPADFEWPRFSYRKGRKNGKRISWSSIFFPSKKKRTEEDSCESEPQIEEVIGDPLSFLAQINLRDVAALDEDNLLPKSGTLCFFYTIGETWSGRDPKEKGCARVFYFPEGSDLTFAVPPNDLNEDFLIPEYALEFKRRLSLPVFDAYERYVDFDDEDDEVDSDFYEKCLDEFGLGEDDDEIGFKLLGYPDVFENPMEEDCEYVTRGFNIMERLPSLDPEERLEIEEAAKDWTLLFQLESYEGEDFDLCFGDCGRLNFWIKKEDLRNCNFDNTQLVSRFD